MSSEQPSYFSVQSCFSFQRMQSFLEGNFPIVHGNTKGASLLRGNCSLSPLSIAPLLHAPRLPSAAPHWWLGV